ncbi:MAG: polysaccharide biosynthesis tyrosine autokinase, partial [Hyphomonas sp.]|nr:polysaccharide biosynthesis tyrosine autokinase [Hyphomonas sp.]
CFVVHVAASNQAIQSGMSDQTFESLRPAATGDRANVVTWAFDFLRRHRNAIIAGAVAGLALATAYLAVTPSVYRSTVEISIDPVQITRMMSDVPQRGAGNVDSGLVESQVELLRSPRIAEMIVDDLKLHETAGEAAPGLIRQLLATAGLRPAVNASVEARRASMIAQIQRSLTVRRAGQSYIIEVTASANDPQLAARIADRAAQSYIDMQLKDGYEAATQTANWLKSRLDELRERAENVGLKVVDFRVENRIATSVDGKLLADQQLQALEAEARARLQRIQSVNEPEASDLTVLDALRNEVITRLRTQYLDGQRRLADLTQRFGATHGAVVTLRTDLLRIQGAIRQEFKRIEEVYTSDLRIAESRLASAKLAYDQSLNASQDTRRAQVQAQGLEAQARTLQAMHENFLQRYTRSQQQQSFPISEARIVSPAIVPVDAAAPRPALSLALALGLGVFAGAGFGLVRDMSDRKIRTMRQVETLVGVSCLGFAPQQNAGSKANADKGLKGAFGNRGTLLTTALDSPFSHFTETLRSARLAIDAISVREGGRVVGMVSSLAGEGKTTIAANLAFLLASTGARTILVDSDLRNPSMSRLLSPKAQAGLPDILSGNTSVKLAIIRDESTGLDFVPGAVGELVADTSGLISSPQMRAFVEALQKSYDYVIIDFPPLLPVVDVRAAVGFVDGFLLVVGWGSTNARTLQDALGSSQDVWSKLLGSILNRANVQQLEHYGEYTKPYYDNRYFKQS